MISTSWYWMLIPTSRNCPLTMLPTRCWVLGFQMTVANPVRITSRPRVTITGRSAEAPWSRRMSTRSTRAPEMEAPTTRMRASATRMGTWCDGDQLPVAEGGDHPHRALGEVEDPRGGVGDHQAGGGDGVAGTEHDRRTRCTGGSCSPTQPRPPIDAHQQRLRARRSGSGLRAASRSDSRNGSRWCCCDRRVVQPLPLAVDHLADQVAVATSSWPPGCWW